MLLAVALAAGLPGVGSLRAQDAAPAAVPSQGPGVSDETAKELAKGIAKRIEGELKYPGRIKVTIIRELRVVEGLGHCPHDEGPEKVNPILLEWLGAS